jgi:hypothetical protein
MRLDKKGGASAQRERTCAALRPYAMHDAEVYAGAGEVVTVRVPLKSAEDLVREEAVPRRIL